LCWSKKRVKRTLHTSQSGERQGGERAAVVPVSPVEVMSACDCD